MFSDVAAFFLCECVVREVLAATEVRVSAVADSCRRSRCWLKQWISSALVVGDAVAPV